MNNHHPNYWYRSLRTCLLVFLLAMTGYAAHSITITPNVTGTCTGGDASVTFTLTGGSAGTHNYDLYSYNGTIYPSQTTPTFTGLDRGYYYLRLGGADSGYVTFNIDYRINSGVVVTNTTCPVNQGTITTNATGGSGGYTYLWSTTSTASSISGLAGGRYQLTITDGAGCRAVVDTQLYANSPMTLTISRSGSVCAPVLTASATGGAGTVTYLWSNTTTGATTTASLANTYYSVTATDANGCTADQAYYNASNNLQIDSANGGSATIVRPGCAGNTGSVTVHIRTGQAPYTWHWTGSSSTDSIATGLAPGSYSVTVTDANGCTGQGYYYLSNTNQVIAYICSATDPACGASDGTLQACAYNGTGTYTYQWTPAAGGASLTGLSAGTYTVTATDQSGCVGTASYTLHGRSTYHVSATSTPTACDTSLYTGTATAVVTGTGGTPPYNYAWYNTRYYPAILVGTTQTVTGISYGSYLNVNVTDANGCIPASSYDSVYIDKDPSCYDHITGYVYDDANTNCTRDAGETGVAGAYINVSGTGTNYWGSPDSTGYYDIQVVPGTYTTDVHFNTYGSCAASSCNSSYNHTFTAIGQVSAGNNFGVDQGAQIFDLTVSAGCTPSTPGTTKTYSVYYYNNGVSSVNNAELTVTHDPNITVASTIPAYTSYNSATHVITWSLGTVNPHGYNNIQVVFNVPTTLTLGSYLSTAIHIEPVSGDCYPGNNTFNMNDMVAASHDPNEKEVSPAGNLSASDTVLNYTVRFQNTGNAPASLVIIRDTLSANVDPGTVVPGVASHPYKFSMSGNGALAFTFSDINLPDSVHDEPGSHGYVTYSVHTRPNLPLYTQVRNTAHIYFDFNDAVVTNTTNNTRSDFATGIKTVNGNSGMAITVSPNPVQDMAIVHISGATGDVVFELMDVAGQKVMETSTSKDIILHADLFAPGMYLYTAKDAAGKTQSGKVLIAH